MAQPADGGGDHLRGDAVIIMVAIGEGTKLAALAQLQQLGAKNILIKIGKAGREQRGDGADQPRAVVRDQAR